MYSFLFSLAGKTKQNTVPASLPPMQDIQSTCHDPAAMEEAATKSSPVASPSMTAGSFSPASSTASASPIRRTLRHTISRISLSSAAAFAGRKSVTRSSSLFFTSSSSTVTAPPLAASAENNEETVKQSHYKLRRLELHPSPKLRVSEQDFARSGTRYVELASLVSYIEQNMPGSSSSPVHATSAHTTASPSPSPLAVSPLKRSDSRGFVRSIRYAKRSLVSCAVLVTPPGSPRSRQATFETAESEGYALDSDVEEDEEEEEDEEDLSPILSLFPSPASSRNVSPASTVLTISSSLPISSASGSPVALGTLNTPAISEYSFKPILSAVSSRSSSENDWDADAEADTEQLNQAARDAQVVTPTPTSDSIYRSMAAASCGQSFRRGVHFEHLSSFDALPLQEEESGEEEEGDLDVDVQEYEEEDEGKMQNPFYLEDEQAYLY
ncbi:MAG: hypothetical protein CYPHOPRED_002299 [Cyphobasidiales sp. Tagirdzhanova-0007]|nr:MAG: hypothetical protein CYPHOPRED_002299 [Cyphobasidiales sp. Tagirdzhanova-0007]